MSWSLFHDKNFERKTCALKTNKCVECAANKKNLV